MTTFPITCPTLGLCLPVKWVHVRDGDTVVVKIPGSVFEWAVRLMDCWCPEKHTTAGRAAANHCKMLLEKYGHNLRLFIPCPDGTNLLKELASFDRILGVLYLGELDTLNRRMVRDGHATEQKDAA